MENLQSNETKLSGNWDFTRTSIEVDSITRRIEKLILE